MMRVAGQLAVVSSSITSDRSSSHSAPPVKLDELEKDESLNVVKKVVSVVVAESEPLLEALTLSPSGSRIQATVPAEVSATAVTEVMSVMVPSTVVVVLTRLVEVVNSSVTEQLIAHPAGDVWAWAGSRT
jgi:hypothetical protein